MVSQQNLVHQNGDRLFVTSLDISNRFGRQHKDVLEAIRSLDCSPEFGRRNFTPSVYHNSQNKAQPMFELTRDGFVFLCDSVFVEHWINWITHVICQASRINKKTALPPSVMGTNTVNRSSIIDAIF